MVAEYDLNAAQLRILVLAVEAWDRYEVAREILNESGLTYDDRFGAPRSRPEVAVERDSRLAFAQLVRALGLRDELRHKSPGKFGRLGL